MPAKNLFYLSILMVFIFIGIVLYYVEKSLVSRRLSSRNHYGNHWLAANRTSRSFHKKCIPERHPMENPIVNRY